MPLKDCYTLGLFTERGENSDMAFGHALEDKPAVSRAAEDCLKNRLPGRAVIRSFQFYGRFLTRALPVCAILKEKISAAPEQPA